MSVAAAGAPPSGPPAPPQRALGTQGLRVSAVGLGCGGMSPARGLPGLYGPPDEAECLATIRRSLDLGCNLIDTAEMYGPFHNESLVGRAIQGRRDEAVVCTKFGFRYDADGGLLAADSSPAHVRASVEGSLKRLGIDTIDLLYQHRIDRTVPIEETVGAMGELVRAGKVRAIGLCEVSAATVRRAHATFPLSAVQSEWSLWERGVEDGLLPVLRELGIGFVAYSPVGRGFLAGTADKAQVAQDGRRAYPRFQGDNYDRNLSLLVRLREIGDAVGATPAQLCIAWLLDQGPDVVPIPGTKRRRWLDENVAAAGLVLDDATRRALADAFPPGVAAGDRYNPALAQYVDR